MDDVSIWFYKKEELTNTKNLPTNDEINDNISDGQKFKLIGKFSDFWDKEDTANRMILEILFKSGKMEDANKFSPSMDQTQEITDFIEREKNYKIAIRAINEQNNLLNNTYYRDLNKIGKAAALRNKATRQASNAVLNVTYNNNIKRYNDAILQVNIVAGQDRILAEQREIQRKKDEARKALEDSQEMLRKARDEQDKANAAIDTPMSIYMRKKMKADTANEMNESSQSTYKHDLVYVFFKVLLFFILGFTFYYLMKDQNPKEMIKQVTETTKVVSEKVAEGVKSIKEKVKETVKEKGSEMIKGNVLIKT
jgi:uncharacterized protein (UPF0333 family)